MSVFVGLLQSFLGSSRLPALVSPRLTCFCWSTELSIAGVCRRHVENATYVNQPMCVSETKIIIGSFSGFEEWLNFITLRTLCCDRTINPHTLISFCSVVKRGRSMWRKFTGAVVVIWTFPSWRIGSRLCERQSWKTSCRSFVFLSHSRSLCSSR